MTFNLFKTKIIVYELDNLASHHQILKDNFVILQLVKELHILCHNDCLKESGRIRGVNCGLEGNFNIYLIVSFHHISYGSYYLNQNLLEKILIKN